MKSGALLPVGIAIGALALIAVPEWLTYAATRRFFAAEAESRRIAQASESRMEAHAAWAHATRYSILESPLLNSQKRPEEKKPFDAQEVWVKAFQWGDVKPLAGAAATRAFGNSEYEVSTVLGFRDRLSDSTLSALFRSDIFRGKDGGANMTALLNGSWSHLRMKCKVYKLDAPGAWIARDWSFEEERYEAGFPFEQIKNYK